MVATDGSIDTRLLERVVAEYREMPGLTLTLDQARRLWGCDAETCQRVAAVLVNRGLLRWSREGHLIQPFRPCG
jgi:hypothetical protein